MASYRRASDLPKLIPVFPLDGTVLLPKGQLPLNIFEPRYLNMIDDAMAGERLIGMIQTRSGGSRAHPRLCAVGCAGRITSYAETSDGRYLITLTGVCRFKVEQELSAQSPYRQVRADFEPFEADLECDAEAAVDEDALAPLEAGRETLLLALRAYLQHRGLDIDWDQAREAPIEALINSLSMALPFEPAEKQALLEAPDTLTRRDALTALLQMGAAAGGDGDTDTPIQ
jgi:Lon protease-like protein